MTINRTDVLHYIQ